ncbi:MULTISPECIES: ABC transporter permease [unclassified Undibacterium]|uniref:ABC transporter permease n=1 Tax=unclassified Undibacterium TaxID=2630295 RepID=UPI002AC92EB7|nr:MULTISPECIES: ABC transporter permease [unclassified Undibacterium]MEB0137675.1 ABC transporter permease [Undibacterium sp. CCC2.1]MEB0172673.1 ABC transporter permease [Undibacterium sp. CCC1.1]MEB0177375.1 ABC transporter permease [Undibacterium sp. CCC3.4]MEB0215468.1 ABC transporter permease [Undibacterium sp. 5I2]WPX42249.1 ABC transporter permease [Undibacterium sp. CCC3.4]
MTIALSVKQISAPPLPLPSERAKLKRELRAAQLKKKLMALTLIAPLAVFLLIIFIVPIAVLLVRGVENPEVAGSLPTTLQTLADWDRQSLPTAPSFAALVADLSVVKASGNGGTLARRINSEIPGARSIVMSTLRALPLHDEQGAPLAGEQIKPALIALHEEWGQLDYWQVIAKNSHFYSPYYVLASLDMKQDGQGHIVPVEQEQAVYLKIFSRTFFISLVVSLCCLALAFPLAYCLSLMNERRANLLMILVLIPFWTSILVRVAAWIVLLQSEGLVNKTLMAAGLIQSPFELLFNRFGVIVSMTHILLPFMILPLYSVMKAIPVTYMRAAISLGSHPFAAFWRVYVPQTIPGVAAGSLLVFILALGYYITPALLGGPNEQMVSYYVAYFTNVTINWGMACALGSLLLAATLVLYAVYQRFTQTAASQ